MVQRWPAMLTGPEGQRVAFKRPVDVPHGWRARRPETQAEIDAVHGVPAEPAPNDDVAIESEQSQPVTQFVGPNGETWAGRGRKPKWLIEAEAAASDSA
jgi:hypothetical protein